MLLFDNSVKYVSWEGVSFKVIFMKQILLRERRQLGLVTLNGNLAVSGRVGLAYDR